MLVQVSSNLLPLNDECSTANPRKYEPTNKYTNPGGPFFLNNARCYYGPVKYDEKCVLIRTVAKLIFSDIKFIFVSGGCNSPPLSCCLQAWS